MQSFYNFTIVLCRLCDKATVYHYTEAIRKNLKIGPVGPELIWNFGA